MTISIQNKISFTLKELSIKMTKLRDAANSVLLLISFLSEQHFETRSMAEANVYW